MTAHMHTDPAQVDLFGTPILPGLSSAESIVSPAEEQGLVARINEAGLTPFKFQQWTGKRLTHSFGWTYDFAEGRIERAEPIPDWLTPLRERAARFAGLELGDLAQALLIRYDPGAGIGWHKDRPVFDHVVGVSLGKAATMRFRRRLGSKFERTHVPLAPRSIYHLSGEARHVWEHSIIEIDEPRWSVTFRSFTRLN